MGYHKGMIHTDIRNGIKEAMLAKDTVRLGVLRGILAAFTNDLVAKGRKPDEILTDDEALDVIRKQAKQRKDSIEQFEKGGRADLAEDEKAELAVIETFLPAQMPYEEVLAYVKLKQTDPTTPEATRGDKNRLMGLVMKDLKGKADGAVVKQAIDSLFS